MDEFITDVYCLAKHCGYAALHDEMVRDRIVVGIRDGHLSDKAVNLTRQSEAIKKQQVSVRGAGDDLQIETNCPASSLYKMWEDTPPW